jgi:hypothetical protein
MKLMWLNDSLVFRAQSPQERMALATVLESLLGRDSSEEEPRGITEAEMPATIPSIV